VKALADVRGIEGAQQVEAIMVEGDEYTIISLYAGATLKMCIKDNLLTQD